MKYLLIVIPSPEGGRPGPESPFDLWNGLTHKVKTSASTSEKIQYISPNAFVVPFDKNVAFLGELIQSAKEYKTPFQMLLLDDVPEWIHFYPPA